MPILSAIQKAAKAVGDALDYRAPNQQRGTQSLFGNRAVDVSQTLSNFGSSGKFQIVRPVYADEGISSQTPQPFIGPQQYYTPYSPPTGGSTGGATGNVVTGKTVVGDTGGAENVINQDVQSDFDVIERDYNDAINQANISEASVNRQGGLAQQEITAQGETTKEAARQELATAQQGIAEQGQTASKTLKTGLQGARDLFRQTQQQNIAQLSALGLSSSSVMEGLAEKLGVETARRMAGLTGSYEEVTQNLAKEGARVKDYAANKIRQIEENVGLQIKSIQGQMIDAIAQIGQQRNVAATAKASARADVLSQARQQIYNLQASAQTFAQQMQTWATQKAQSLADVNKEFTISQEGLGQAVQSAVSQMPSLGGLTYVPEITQGSNNLYKIGGKYVKSTNDEELANPFATQ